MWKRSSKRPPSTCCLPEKRPDIFQKFILQADSIVPSVESTRGFEGARYGIDRLKEIVLAWKREVSPDDEEWIEGHFHPEENK